MCLGLSLNNFEIKFVASFAVDSPHQRKFDHPTAQPKLFKK